MSEFLYIHIPFCIKKCLYCDFLSFPYDTLLVEHYINALCRELELKRQHAGVLQAIYIGGGTPSLLPEEHFRNLFSCLLNNYILSSVHEITVEANPGTIDKKKIDTLFTLGVNRLSIGIQSFYNSELKTLGRIHTAEDAERSLDLIKKSGLTNFSIDLMYGIPGQKLTSWHDSLTKAIEYSPAHISTYELTPEENTPLYQSLKSRELVMPDEEQILTMYSNGIDSLESYGYKHYEISNFAIKDFECRHNLNYWKPGEYLGAGAGAHSFLNNVRSKNTGDIHKYIADLSHGIIPETDVLRLNPGESLKEYIFLGLRKKEGIQINRLDILLRNVTDLCRELIEEGFLEISGDSLRLTKKGLPLSNTVIVKLFEKFGL